MELIDQPARVHLRHRQVHRVRAWRYELRLAQGGAVVLGNGRQGLCPVELGNAQFLQWRQTLQEFGQTCYFARIFIWKCTDFRCHFLNLAELTSHMQQCVQFTREALRF